MKKWHYHRVEAHSRDELDGLLTDCGQNAYELVHVERILETHPQAEMLKTTSAGVPAPKEPWILFFKQPIG
jgi:hypothetical protein